LSVEAFQTRSTWLLPATVAATPVGAVGAVVSVELCVVLETVFEFALTLPAASTACTRCR